MGEKDEKTLAAILKITPLKYPKKAGEVLRALNPEKLGSFYAGAYLVHSPETLKKNAENLAAYLATLPIEDRETVIKQIEKDQAAYDAEQEQLIAAEAEQPKPPPKPLEFEEWCQSDAGKGIILAKLGAHDYGIWELRRQFPDDTVEQYCARIDSATNPEIRTPPWEHEDYPEGPPQKYLQAHGHRAWGRRITQERYDVPKKVRKLFDQIVGSCRDDK